MTKRCRDDGKIARNAAGSPRSTSRRFEVALRLPWTAQVRPQHSTSSVFATLPAGTVLVHEGTDWTIQGCAGFENPVLVSRYRIVAGEHAGEQAEAVEFLDMHWKEFDEACCFVQFFRKRAARPADERGRGTGTCLDCRKPSVDHTT